MVRIATAAVLLGACLLAGCVSTKPQYIGTARMLSDLTIEQQLIAGHDKRALGEVRMVLKPGDPDYREAMDRVGGLRPGQIKAVPAPATS